MSEAANSKPCKDNTRTALYILYLILGFIRKNMKIKVVKMSTICIRTWCIVLIHPLYYRPCTHSMFKMHFCIVITEPDICCLQCT